MKKRFAVLLLTFCLLLSMAPCAFAAEVTEGSEPAQTAETTETTEATEATRPADACGENLTWSYYEGTLTVTGVGAMDDMSGGAPWEDIKADIVTVVLSGGVTTVGAKAFAGCGNLVTINFGGSLREIDTEAFRDCAKLESIRLSASFRRFGRESFAGCGNLTEVNCEGGMPSFNANCLWNGNYVTVFCPVNQIWPESKVRELEENFGGRLEVLCADGTDPFPDLETEDEEETTEPSASKPTEAPTEPETQPTEAVTEATAPETEDPTQAPTEAPAEVPTQAATQPSAEAPDQEEPEEEETVPAFTQPEKERTSGAAGIAIGVMVVSALGIGIILYALKTGGKGKGGKYQI